MSNRLRISDSLTLPLDFVTSTQVILAQKGKGKTHTAVVEEEELLDAGQQVVVIDPTDAHWGLRSSPDGRSTGYAIAVFGGDHGDVALEPDGGKLLAEAIVRERFSAIISTENLSKGKELAFVADFLETLYRLNREALHLFVDEADIFAPQKPFGGEARTCGAMDDIVRRGRKKGIGCTLITQRSSVLNKNVLSQADMLVALGCSHPRDLDAIGEWVKVHADPARAKQMMESLPSLPRGDAWVWNPTAEIFKRVTVRERHTFDSGRTPKPGETKRVAKVLAPVDIQKLGASIAAQVERAKENDPAALKLELAKARKLIADLKTTNDALGVSAMKAEGKVRERDLKPAKVVERAIVKDSQLQQLERMEKRFDEKVASAIAEAAKVASIGGALVDAAKVLHDASEKLAVAISTARQPQVHPDLADAVERNYGVKLERVPAGPGAQRWQPKRSVPAPAPANGERPTGDGGPISPGEAKILAAAIQYGGVSKDNLRVLCGYKRSARDTYISRLVKRGYVVVHADGMVMPMPDGVAALPDAEPLPTGLELREYWRTRLPPGEQLILDELVAIYPGDRERGGLAAGKYQRSARDTYISRLKKRGLVSVFGSSVRASEVLFS